MAEQKSASTVVRQFAKDMGLEFGLTSAKRARLIGDAIKAECDESVIDELMYSGISVHLGKMISEQRRFVSSSMAKQGLSVVKGDATAQISYLDLPIVIPGEAQMLLRYATQINLQVAHDSLRMHRRGIDKSERQLNVLLSALIGLPQNEPIESLVNRGLLDLNRIFGIQAA